MFPKLCCLVCAFLLAESAIADCGFVPAQENDSRIGFEVYDTDGHDGALKVKVERLAELNRVSALAVVYFSKVMDRAESVSIDLALSEEGESYVGFIAYTPVDPSFTVRVVVEVRHQAPSDCSFLFANEWKHNQSNKAPAPQAGTH